MERSNCSDWFTNFSMKMYLFREERVANWLSGAAEVDWLRGNEEEAWDASSGGKGPGVRTSQGWDGA
jgi:hypothetical protein